MKVIITSEEVKFLANMVLMGDQPMTVPTELDDSWTGWVTAPIAQHRIAPREAKALLTTVGILTDYGISINKIIEIILEAFVENYGYFDLKNAGGQEDRS